MTPAGGETGLRRFVPLVRLALQFAIAAGLLAVLLARVDTGAIREQVSRADIAWLPLAFAASISSQWFRAIRLRHLILPLKPLAVPFLFLTALVAIVSNLVLPFRAGDVVKVQIVRVRSGLHLSSVVAATLSEKLMDTVVFAAFILVGIFFFSEAHFLWPLGAAYGGLVVVGVVGAHHLAGRSQGDIPGLTFGKGRLGDWFSKELHRFGRGFQSFRQAGSTFHIAWTALAAWLCESAVYFSFGQALGLDVSLGMYLLVVVTTSIAVSLPLTQGGVGTYELALTAMLVASGVDETKAAAYAIFAHLFVALPYLILGPLAAFALRLSLPDILFLRKPENVRMGQPALQRLLN